MQPFCLLIYQINDTHTHTHTHTHTRVSLEERFRGGEITCVCSQYDGTIFGADSRYVVLLLIPTIYLAFKLILILPKISLNKSISVLSGKEFNDLSGKLFLIFLIITLAFILPTYLIFAVQVYLLQNMQEFYKFFKPFFDFISFFVSYLNYAAVFAALSYSYKATKK